MRCVKLSYLDEILKQYVCQQALNSELLFSNHRSVFLIIAVSLQFVPNNYDVFSLNLWEMRNIRALKVNLQT